MRYLAVSAFIWFGSASGVAQTAPPGTPTLPTAATTTESPEQRIPTELLANDKLAVPAQLFYQFVSLQEYDGRKNVTLDWLRALDDKDKLQHRLYVDMGSTIRILFDVAKLESLSETNAFFVEGQLSLAANVGQRPLEVQGYSEVGKLRTTIGSTGRGPHRFLLDLRQLQEELLNLANDKIPPTEYAAHAQLVNKLLIKLLEDSASSVAFFRVMNVSPTYVQETATQLSDVLQELDREAAKRASTGGDDAMNNALHAWQAAEMRRRSVEEEITQLRTTSDKAIPRDKQDALAAAKADVMALGDVYWKALDASVQGLRLSYNDRLRPILVELNGNMNASFVLPTPPTTIKSALDQYWDTPEGRGLPPRRSRVFVEMFRNLADAQIVLKDADVHPGDVVSIQLLLFQPKEGSQGDERQTEPVAFTIAELHVRDFGWKLDVVDSFLLVYRQRHGESANESPSNYKGAAGVSLLWGCNRRPPHDNWWNRNASWGLNVSFLDFDTTKDVEFGAGPILGLFRDQVHMGYGWNMNLDGSAAQRAYWFVGFSFAKLFDRTTKSADGK